MSDLFTPGDHRAGELMSDRALVAAMIRVEWAWYAALTEAGIAPPVDLPEVELSAAELGELAIAAEAGGNPVIPLVKVLRARISETRSEPVEGWPTDSASAAGWLHRGLTSQDVVDTALILLLRDVLAAVISELAGQIQTLQRLAEQHSTTLCVGRTLTQHAVPTTFGLIAAGWLDGLLDVIGELDGLRRKLPVQIGGAAGTLSGVELMAPGRSLELVTAVAARLQLAPAGVWHVSRRFVTGIADGLVAGVDAWSLIANDVLIRSRPEIAELAEGAAEGRGGSSTMPHKQNPVLSVLIKRSALNAPFLAAAVHAAASAAVDQRPDGGWHAEWAPLRTLARLTAATASQVSELLSHLRVDEQAMAATARAAADDLLAEARSLAALAGVTPPSDLVGYLGAQAQLIEASSDRADVVLGGLGR